MQTVTIYSKTSERDIEYLLCLNTASLIYMANLGCIEINPWNLRIGNLDFPDYGISDLDQPQDIDLHAAEIAGYCKTSSSKGLHIYIPMAARYTYEEVRNFVKLPCHIVHQSLPSTTTI